MSILVNTNNEREEQLLMAFLNNHRLDYQTAALKEGKESIAAFIELYNREIDEADAEIDAGNFKTHVEVEQILR